MQGVLLFACFYAYCAALVREREPAFARHRQPARTAARATRRSVCAGRFGGARRRTEHPHGRRTAQQRAQRQTPRRALQTQRAKKRMEPDAHAIDGLRVAQLPGERACARRMMAQRAHQMTARGTRSVERVGKTGAQWTVHGIQVQAAIKKRQTRRGVLQRQHHLCQRRGRNGLKEGRFGAATAADGRADRVGACDAIDMCDRLQVIRDRRKSAGIGVFTRTKRARSRPLRTRAVHDARAVCSARQSGMHQKRDVNLQESTCFATIRSCPFYNEHW